MNILSEEDADRLKKRNRIKKLSPKTHKIANVSGRSIKNLLRLKMSKAKRG